MKDCAYYQELISRLIDRELTLEEGEELAAHARSCPECQAVYKAFSTLSGTLSDELEEPPEELAENVMAQIRREEVVVGGIPCVRYAVCRKPKGMMIFVL